MEVLCRVKAVSICGTDSHLIAGDYPGFWPPAFPIIPGHEWAGRDRQARTGRGEGRLEHRRPRGRHQPRCLRRLPACVEGRYNLCQNYGVMDLHRQYGHNYQGADAEYVVHGVKCVFPLPDDDQLGRGCRHRPRVDRAARGQPRQHPAGRQRGHHGWRGHRPARRRRRQGRGAGRVIVVEPLACAARRPSTWASRSSTRQAGDAGATLREMTGGLGVDR